MKTLTILVAIMMTLSGNAMAEDSPHGSMNHERHQKQTMDHANHEHPSRVLSVRQMEASKVCMVNDTAFDREQIAVEVAGKTYYGCCDMCEDRLNKDASIRKAIDLISGVEIDKASAVIGADKSGKVYYFENEKNLHKHMGH